MSINYQQILLWAEVWSTAIPLLVYLFRPADTKNIRPVLIFLVAALACGTFATVISEKTFYIPPQYRNNGIAYNLLAFLKVTVLGWFIQKQPQMQKFAYLRYIMWGYIILVILLFAFGFSPFNLNNYLLSATSIVMLIICLTFFLNTILDDEYNHKESFWLFLLCTSIGIYEVVNFFIYLFLFELYISDEAFSLFTSSLFEYSHIISNAFITWSIYKVCYPSSSKKLNQVKYPLS